MLTEEELAEESLNGAWIIQPVLVSDWDDDTEGGRAQRVRRLVPVTTELRGEIAEEFARYFRREASFDFPPFESGDRVKPNRHVYLINSKHFARMVPVAVGAVEVRVVADKPVLMWCWLHPFERRKIWKAAWDELTAIHGELYIQGPLRGAMQAFRTRVGVPDERIVELVRREG